MCPTALGRKEKKLSNVHIVHWMHQKTDDERSVKHEKWQISSLFESITMISARDASASEKDRNEYQDIFV